MKCVPFSLNIGERIIAFSRPAVMGILNATPDSFFLGSRANEPAKIADRVERMVAEGVDIIDVGGCSTRPGSESVSEQEEMDRICHALEILRRHAPQVPVSVDTFRARIASEAIEKYGANIINDISGGEADSEMFATVERLKVPYILTHMRGTPDTMQQLTDYIDVTAEVISQLSAPLHRLQLAGVSDVIVDPGFGFAKTLSQNYELLRNLPTICRMLERPVLVGVSRKSMITQLAQCSADDALAGSIALNSFAALNGASILRVHDVGATRQALTVIEALQC